MNPEKISVIQENVSPEQAGYIEKYFLKPYRNPDRNHLIFISISGDYSADTERMHITAELRENVSAEIGKAALESAFRFAAEMPEASGQ